MAELNYSLIQEAIQRLEGDGLYLPAQEIIAALEDRERLRAAAQKILDDVCHDARIYPNELVVFDRYVDALQAALEGRDARAVGGAGDLR